MQDTHFIHKLTFHARHSLQESRSLALFAKSKTVGPEHLLLAIFLENGSLGNNLLESMGFEKERLSKLCLKKGIIQKKLPNNKIIIPPSQNLKLVMERAYSIANQFQSPYVGTEHLVYSLLEADDTALDDIFLELEIDEKKIETTLATHMGFEKMPDLARLFDMQEPRGNDVLFGKTKKEDSGLSPTLAQYAIDLTHPKSTPEHALSGREEEFTRLTQILARKQKSNPLLLGEPGVGKTALVSALAQRIKSGAVPRQLIGKRIYALDLALIVAGTNFRGEFEARFKEIIREATESDNIILFIDEIHTSLEPVIKVAALMLLIS
jgi:ATP-dependent Clp protease ATP-binding subunit ClpC